MLSRHAKTDKEKERCKGTETERTRKPEDVEPDEIDSTDKDTTDLGDYTTHSNLSAPILYHSIFLLNSVQCCFPPTSLTYLILVLIRLIKPCQPPFVISSTSNSLFFPELYPGRCLKLHLIH